MRRWLIRRRRRRRKVFFATDVTERERDTRAGLAIKSKTGGGGGGEWIHLPPTCIWTLLEGGRGIGTYGRKNTCRPPVSSSFLSAILSASLPFSL